MPNLIKVLKEFPLRNAWSFSSELFKDIYCLVSAYVASKIYYNIIQKVCARESYFTSETALQEQGTLGRSVTKSFFMTSKTKYFYVKFNQVEMQHYFKIHCFLCILATGKKCYG